MTPTGAVDAALVGKVWQWLGTVTGVGPLTVADSTRYTIEFMADGTASITADCNMVTAQFTADGSAITLTPGASTMALCPEDSQADVFTQQLSGAALYFFLDGDLYIDLIADSGTMHFGKHRQFQHHLPQRQYQHSRCHCQPARQPQGLLATDLPGSDGSIFGTLYMGIKITIGVIVDYATRRTHQHRAQTKYQHQ